MCNFTFLFYFFMFKKKYVLVIQLLLVFFLACKKQDQANVVSQKQDSKMNVVVKHKSFKTISNYATKELQNWKAYTDLSQYIKRFEKISPDNALSNATDLKKLIIDVKKQDSIPALKTRAFKARLNVLQNEVLRLYDMSLIPSITPKEVNKQVEKILFVFSSVNSKINTVFLQDQYNKEVDLDSFFQLDSTEINFKNKKREPPLKR